LRSCEGIRSQAHCPPHHQSRHCALCAATPTPCCSPLSVFLVGTMNPFRPELGTRIVTALAALVPHSNYSLFPNSVTLPRIPFGFVPLMSPRGIPALRHYPHCHPSIPYLPECCYAGRSALSRQDNHFACDPPYPVPAVRAPEMQSMAHQSLYNCLTFY
jgi:hypothetical protein